MRAIRRLPDPEAVSRAAAQDLVELARAAIADRGRFCVALSGGSTPRRMYEILRRVAPLGAARLAARRVLLGDERAVGPEHPESNYGVAASVLLGKLGVMPERIHRIQGELPDPEQAAARYQDELSRVFASPADGLPPIFDLIFLGHGRRRPHRIALPVQPGPDRAAPLGGRLLPWPGSARPGSR